MAWGVFLAASRTVLTLALALAVMTRAATTFEAVVFTVAVIAFGHLRAAIADASAMNAERFFLVASWIRRQTPEPDESVSSLGGFLERTDWPTSDLISAMRKGVEQHQASVKAGIVGTWITNALLWVAVIFRLLN